MDIYGYGGGGGGELIVVESESGGIPRRAEQFGILRAQSGPVHSVSSAARAASNERARSSELQESDHNVRQRDHGGWEHRGVSSTGPRARHPRGGRGG